MTEKKEDKFIQWVLFATGISSILIIILIIAFIFSEGLPAIFSIGLFNFIFGMIWNPDIGLYGVFPMIIGTLLTTFLALLMAIPLSLCCSIFLAEIAPPNMRKLLKPTIQGLAGIPSVIYGFFGLVIIVPFIRIHFGGSGFSVISASLILTIMILPTIISISEDALKSVPFEYNEASLALGATQWQTIKNVIVPAAVPGIITAIILGMGRAIGETMAVIMVTGNVVQIPGSIFEPVRTLTSNIALEMGYATGLHYSALFSTGIILLTVIVILLLIANYFNYKTKVTIGGGYL